MSRSWVITTMVIPRSLPQAPEDLHHFVAGRRVEVAGGLVGEQERRLRDQRAGNGHALLLAAGELVGMMVRAVGEPHRVERRHRAFAPLGRLDDALARVEQRQLDVLERRGARQQVEALEDEADASRCARAPARPAAAWRRRGRSARSGPVVGRSRHPRMCMNVDLPEPDGPTMVTNSPASSHRHRDAPERVHGVVADVVCLAQTA